MYSFICLLRDYEAGGKEKRGRFNTVLLWISVFLKIELSFSLNLMTMNENPFYLGQLIPPSQGTPAPTFIQCVLRKDWCSLHFVNVLLLRAGNEPITPFPPFSLIHLASDFKPTYAGNWCQGFGLFVTTSFKLVSKDMKLSCFHTAPWKCSCHKAESCSSPLRAIKIWFKPFDLLPNRLHSPIFVTG